MLDFPNFGTITGELKQLYDNSNQPCCGAIHEDMPVKLKVYCTAIHYWRRSHTDIGMLTQDHFSRSAHVTNCAGAIISAAVELYALHLQPNNDAILQRLAKTRYELSFAFRPLSNPSVAAYSVFRSTIADHFFRDIVFTMGGNSV